MSVCVIPAAFCGTLSAYARVRKIPATVNFGKGCF
jgi:hypothetical protein